MGMTALVTGHRGFVGRHITAALVERGYHVTGVDIAAAGAGIAGVDCRDYFRQSSARFDLVVHCAAVVGGRAMIDGHPLRLAAEDLSIDAELFRWALRTRPGRMVLFSSSAAYPVDLQGRDWQGTRLGELDIRPGHPSMPDATYGWVKLTLERLADEANRLGIRCHVFRPFSGYGEDQHHGYPFPAIMARARAAVADGDKFLQVWGDPGSGRDWVHIDDVVGAVLAHVDADALGPVNICTGRATTFRELAEMALAELGATLPIIGDTTKPTGVFWRVGDPELMQWNYTPTVTIEEGITRAMRHHRATT